MFAFDLPHHPYCRDCGVSDRSRFQKSHVKNRASGNYVTNFYHMKKVYAKAKNTSLPICKSEKQYVERRY